MSRLRLGANIDVNILLTRLVVTHPWCLVSLQLRTTISSITHKSQRISFSDYMEVNFIDKAASPLIKNPPSIRLLCQTPGAGSGFHEFQCRSHQVSRNVRKFTFYIVTHELLKALSIYRKTKRTISFLLTVSLIRVTTLRSAVSLDCDTLVEFHISYV